MRICKILLRTSLLAIAALAAVSSESRADLFIRVTAFDSLGNQIGQDTASVSLSNPPPTVSSISRTSTLTDFDIVLTNNVALTSGGTTKHTETVNITYTGGTGSSSDKLVVEFLGTNYLHPPTGQAIVTANGSPSTAGLAANSVTYASGVSNSNAGLPGTVGSTAGLAGTLTLSGSIGSASSVLLPNPGAGPVFSISNPFSFYQVATLSGFSVTGDIGNLSLASTVTAVPEPSTMALAALAAPALLLTLRRRRRSDG